MTGKLASGLAAAIAKLQETALDALNEATETIVKPDAVAKAPLLLPNEMERAGRVGGKEGGLPDELRRSCEVVEDRGAKEVEISFNTPYSERQHERLDWKHEVGQSKFLESAVNSTRDDVLEFMADKCREVLR